MDAETIQCNHWANRVFAACTRSGMCRVGQKCSAAPADAHWPRGRDRLTPVLLTISKRPLRVRRWTIPRPTRFQRHVEVSTTQSSSVIHQRPLRQHHYGPSGPRRYRSIRYSITGCQGCLWRATCGSLGADEEQTVDAWKTSGSSVEGACVHFTPSWAFCICSSLAEPLTIQVGFVDHSIEVRLLGRYQQWDPSSMESAF